MNIGAEGGGIYARQVERGNCIVGGVRGAPLADPEYSRPVGRRRRHRHESRRRNVPGPAHAHAIRFWTRDGGEMPDRNPVIGHSRTTPGLIHAFGFSGAGFQIAPGVGEVVAELVRDGYSATPIDGFRHRPIFTAPIHGSGAESNIEPQQRETSQ